MQIHDTTLEELLVLGEADFFAKHPNNHGWEHFRLTSTNLLFWRAQDEEWGRLSLNDLGYLKKCKLKLIIED